MPRRTRTPALLTAGTRDTRDTLPAEYDEIHGTRTPRTRPQPAPRFAQDPRPPHADRCSPVTAASTTLPADSDPRRCLSTLDARHSMLTASRFPPSASRAGARHTHPLRATPAHLTRSQQASPLPATCARRSAACRIRACCQLPAAAVSSCLPLIARRPLPVTAAVRAHMEAARVVQNTPRRICVVATRAQRGRARNFAVLCPTDPAALYLSLSTLSLPGDPKAHPHRVAAHTRRARRGAPHCPQWRAGYMGVNTHPALPDRFAIPTNGSASEIEAHYLVHRLPSPRQLVQHPGQPRRKNLTGTGSEHIALDTVKQDSVHYAVFPISLRASRPAHSAQLIPLPLGV
ncbi:hypothetical protein GGX14DRAFT_637732 [Mycena pura]|uniref:Uncharacterized protein n=1 Tax=Mycena pura TaxID=153505 RepID=A0AAD6VDG4_9AGAR|nr:hypothetical protein GGX14DRAFT_637732 [Mycena pura]